jgi:dihydroxyacid dehydratase/phosphogluconate dehydratase
MTEPALHAAVEAVTARIVARSARTRAAYLDLIARERDEGVDRPRLSCGNLAHGFAAAGDDKAAIRSGNAMNIAVVTAYNDMLSAHQPYGRYPEAIKLYAREVGVTAQVAADHLTIEAPARVFADQDEVEAAFSAGELDRDVVVVVRYQGPRANGMPELHRLTPALGVLQDRGHKVALVTDGRMSGASGKVPAAIHVTPESLSGGPIGWLRDGDIVRLCARTGELSARVDAADWEGRPPAAAPATRPGTGRELFAFMRSGADTPEQGASAMLAAAGL